MDVNRSEAFVKIQKKKKKSGGGGGGSGRGVGLGVKVDVNGEVKLKNIYLWGSRVAGGSGWMFCFVLILV